MANTQVFTTVDSLQNHLSALANNCTVGFVPTMGALHDGHISLVKIAADSCDVVVVSIFVNPTQFNDPKDLEKYPRTLESDIELLEKSTQCVVFAPLVNDIYRENHIPKRVNLGKLGSVLEGQFREGHFDGVVEVVYRLFDIVKPTSAYFGEKDFQQLAVIKKMVEEFDMGIDVVACPIYREPGGLAASSRNQRLSEQEKEEALILYRLLSEVKDRKDEMNPAEAKDFVANAVSQSNLQLEYIEFVDADSFDVLESWTDNSRACIAAFCGPVRLIDNMSMV